MSSLLSFIFVFVYLFPDSLLQFKLQHKKLNYTLCSVVLQLDVTTNKNIHLLWPICDVVMALLQDYFLFPWVKTDTNYIHYWRLYFPISGKYQGPMTSATDVFIFIISLPTANCFNTWSSRCGKCELEAFSGATLNNQCWVQDSNYPSLLSLSFSSSLSL